MALTLLLSCALIGLLTYLVFKMRNHFNYWQQRGIACEEPSYGLGNFTGVQKTRSFTEVFLDYYKKFKGTGPFAGFYFFQRASVFVLDLELIKQILIKDFNKFTDRGFYSNVRDDPLSGQIFLLDGHKWRNMRHKLTPTFTSGKMKFMFPTVVKVGHEFVRVFGDMVAKDTVVEVRELLARFTTDIIGTTAFGIDCNSLKDPEAEFRVKSKRVFIDTRHGRLGAAFRNSFPQLALKLRMKQTPQHIEDFFMRIVRETVTHRETNNIRRNDFMDMLIQLKNNKSMKSEDDDAELKCLTLEELAAQAFVFFTAGFETSSTTMAFALYELAQHEDIQQKAREEITAVLAKHNQEFTYECMREMQYLNQIIAETLRLYTVVSILSRCCLEDYPVPGHPNYVIKKGMFVIIPTSAIHRDADYYPNPDVFNPDNFSPEMVKERDIVKWLPFGEGPRNCIGKRFGQMQARIGLALLLSQFKFSVCAETQIPMKYDKEAFLISPESGIYLKVEKL